MKKGQGNDDKVHLPYGDQRQAGSWEGNNEGAQKAKALSGPRWVQILASPLLDLGRVTVLPSL